MAALYMTELWKKQATELSSVLIIDTMPTLETLVWTYFELSCRCFSVKKCFNPSHARNCQCTRNVCLPPSAVSEDGKHSIYRTFFLNRWRWRSEQNDLTQVRAWGLFGRSRKSLVRLLVGCLKHCRTLGACSEKRAWVLQRPPHSRVKNHTSKSRITEELCPNTDQYLVALPRSVLAFLFVRIYGRGWRPTRSSFSETEQRQTVDIRYAPLVSL